ncbi:hypothetical protein AWA1501_04700 [Lactiplantibacillus pentosus]|nr:hypothetical protein AWA1501_04700 [Lactiplantibacillus pentosus]
MPTLLGFFVVPFSEIAVHRHYPSHNSRDMCGTRQLILNKHALRRNWNDDTQGDASEAVYQSHLLRRVAD